MPSAHTAPVRDNGEVVPHGTGRAGKDTGGTVAPGLLVSSEKPPRRQEGQPPPPRWEPGLRGARLVWFCGAGGEEGRGYPTPNASHHSPCPPSGSPDAAHRPRPRRSAQVFWAAGGSWELHSLPAARRAGLGETGLYCCAQLCKQVSQCYQGPRSCDFSQLKKQI